MDLKAQENSITDVSLWYEVIKVLPDERAVKNLMQTILALSNKGKIEQLKQIAELPWEGKSPFVRVAALRSLWHLTSAHEYREAYIALRKRVQHSLIQQLGQTRADYLMRGLFTENFRKSLQGTLDAHSSGEKTKSKSS